MPENSEPESSETISVEEAARRLGQHMTVVEAQQEALTHVLRAVVFAHPNLDAFVKEIASRAGFTREALQDSKGDAWRLQLYESTIESVTPMATHATILPHRHG